MAIPISIYVNKPRIQECTVISELRDRDSHGLRVAVADADVDRLDAGLFGGGGSGTMKLEKDHPLALPIT